MKRKDELGKERWKNGGNRGRRSLRGDEVIQVIGIGIVIKITIGRGIGIEIETQIVKGLGSMMLEVIEMGEGGWIIG